MRRGPMSPPVKEGDEITVKIDAIGEKGDGIAKVNGFVLFVPGVKENEEVKVRVTKVLRRVGFAEVIGKPEEGAEAPAEEEPAEEEAPEEAEKEETEESEEFGEEEKEEPAEPEDLEDLELPKDEDEEQPEED
jgi:predicted RNA-binding protein with TRAM domain